MPPTGPRHYPRRPIRPCLTAIWLLPSLPMIKHPRHRTVAALAGSSLLAIFALAAAPARAELQVSVTQGVTDPIPIAIVPFGRAVPADGGLDLAGVVQHDLESSGRFRAMHRRDMLTTPN